MEELQFTVSRVTFHNPDSGWSVLRAEDGKSTVVGSFNGVNVGDTFLAKGQWEKSKFGMQFKAQSYVSIEPTTEKGILTYLKGGAVGGIGPSTAERIVNIFGVASLEAIEDPERLKRVPGIGPKKAKKIAEKAKEGKFTRQIYVFLNGHGITPSQAAKIFKRYEMDSINVVKKNPFRLAFDIDGIGFLTCDKIAASLGMGKDHIERVKSGCIYFIDQSSNDKGNVYVTGHEYVPVLSGNLGVAKELVSEALMALVDQSDLICEMVNGEARYYLPKLHRAEVGIAEEVMRILRGGVPNRARAKAAMEQALKENSINLSDEQREAVESIVVQNNKFSVFTGGPGTGKTTCTNVVIKSFENMGLNVVLASPTGRAAKRMTELSGRNARTIHRLLEYDPVNGGFQRGKEYPLDGDVFIFDEMSMVDLALAHSLTKAIPSHAIVVFVGDVDQLPSVGPGSVLKDLIESGSVNVCKLTKFFRQSEDSKIIAAAHSVNRGEIPQEIFEKNPNADAFFFAYEEEEQILQTIVKLITNNLKNKGFKPDDIQVLCPMNKGTIGTNNLNTLLQGILNPPEEGRYEIAKGASRVFRVGDRVIQTVNNYDITQSGIMNGDMGKIQHIDLDTRQVVIDYGQTYFGGKQEYLVTYQYAELDQINLAYAMSIHKCVHPDTLVETPEGIFPIKDLPKEGFIATPDGAKAYHGKFTKAKGKVFKLTTRSGYTLTVSPEHGVTAWDGERLVRTEARDLIVGDLLRLKLGATTDVQEAPKLPGTPSADVRAVIYPLPERLSEEVAEFFGLMVADGTVFKGGFRLIKRYPSVVQRFGSLAQKIFGAKPVPCETEGTPGLEICSTFLVNWLKAVGGMEPNKKAIPEVIFKAPLHMQAAFLRGLFEDGTVNIKDRVADHIEWSNYNPELAAQVQTLLLRFGIVSSLKQRRTQDKLIVSLYLYSENLRRFSELIGFVADEKNQRISEGRIAKNTRHGIPVSKSELLEIRKLLSLFDYRNARIRRMLSRNKLEGVLRKEAVPAWLVERSQWHYEDIVSIEEEESETMCVTVPDGHRFLQNGFDGWNSQGSEYPCVLIPITTGSWNMLQRNLIYTGITRAKRFFVGLGQRKAFSYAVRNNPVLKRNSGLVERLATAAHRYHVIDRASV